ncbi:oxidoreductase [Wolbachia pipientis]|uniref:Oxidoreductase n=1 Tax=Wolbachia pipientis TaxID=955 RepID=A0A1E7QKW8_WOLPI|nr:oxidoreductase [Wolbachia pipientis]OEY87122.1 oxidoreductase [Wolbachia pipientis]
MKNIMLVGGGVGNAVLFSIGKAALAKGNKVLYFTGYKKLNDLFKRTLIESACNVVVWACEEGLIETARMQDYAFQGNIVDAMVYYRQQLDSIDKIIVIGSDKMMKAVNEARKTVLRPYLQSNHEAISSINSPMQCMMKGICARCIQRHVIMGKESFTYSCSNQDQDMKSTDFDFLSVRLKQNSLQEKLTAKWILHSV